MKYAGPTKVCVALAEDDAAAVIKKGAAFTQSVDVVEVRVDAMNVPDIKTVAEHLDTDLLFTNRPVWEGGAFAGDESRRIDLLIDAVEHGAAFIDVELRSPRESVERVQRKLQGKDTKLILSYHDFNGTPSCTELKKIVGLMHSQGADIGKLVTTAETPDDVLRVISMQMEAAKLDIDLIAFCMGDAGKISRFATSYLGGFMTYCSATDEGGTAPGQISVATYNKMKALLG